MSGLQVFDVLIFCVTDPTPERDKSPEPGRDSISPVPDMDWKRLRLSLNSPVLSPLNQPIVPVRVSDKTSCQMNTDLLTADGLWVFCLKHTEKELVFT